MKLGGGVFDLNGAAAYAGSTKVNGGVLVAISTSSLAGYSTTFSASSVSVAAGSTLAVQAAAQTGEFGTSDVNNVLGTANFASGANFGIQVVAPESVSYGGPGNSISGSIGFMVLGSGTLALGGANTYSGSTTISSGVLVVASTVSSGIAGPLGDSTANIGLGDANSGASAVELAVSGGYAIGRNVLVAANTNSSALATLASLTNNTATYGGTITLGSPLSIASAAMGGNSLIFSGLLTSPSEALSGVTVTGGSVSFTYAGSESYTGGTTVSGGSLGVGVGTWLPATTLTQSGSSLVTLQTSGTQSLAALSGSPGTALNLKSSSALVVGSGSYAGSISGNAATLTKTGSGTLTLGGSNFYTGPTTLNAGILKAGAAYVFAPASAMVINGGTLDATGFPEKTGGLDVGQFGFAQFDDRRRSQQQRCGHADWHARPLRRRRRDHGVD